MRRRRMKKHVVQVTTMMGIKSQNEWNWKPWYVYDSHKRKWFQSLAFAFIQQSNLESTLMGRWKCGQDKDLFRFVKVVSYRKRLLDEGNLVGGAKPILDFLVQHDYLVDDDPKHCKVSYIQKVDTKNPRTVITIWDEDAASGSIQQNCEAPASVNTRAVGRKTTQRRHKQARHSSS
jgi:hypothetical protein